MVRVCVLCVPAAGEKFRRRQGRLYTLLLLFCKIFFGTVRGSGKAFPGSIALCLHLFFFSRYEGYILGLGVLDMPPYACLVIFIIFVVFARLMAMFLKFLLYGFCFGSHHFILCSANGPAGRGTHTHPSGAYGSRVLLIREESQCENLVVLLNVYSG